VPYGDKFYYERRPTQAVPAQNVLQIGTDRNGSHLGYHPLLSGLKSIFDQGHIAVLPRVGYENSSRSHFVGSDILSTADPNHSHGNGWLGRYLDTLPDPADVLAGWNTQFQLPRALMADRFGVPSITTPSAYAYFHPWGEGKAAAALASETASDNPQVAFINATTRAALDTIPRVEAVSRQGSTCT
jgi:hypothetical protein